MISIDLSGKWTLKKISDNSLYECSIPGDNISALLEAQAVEDPYFADNELALQWIGREDWSFSTSFNADKSITESPDIFLELENVDTVFELYVNGRRAGDGANAFRRYRFSLKNLITDGLNNIDVIIRSPEKAAADAAGQLPYPVPHAEFPVQSPGRNLIRKTQCHSGWDWGPCLMVSGIYSSPLLKAGPLERIEACYYDIKPAGSSLDAWSIDIKTDIFSAAAGTTKLAVNCAGKTASTDIELSKGLQTAFISLDVDDIEPWWPAGHGKQPLYEISVATENDKITDSIGFRTAEVITEENELGIGMTFRINGRDIFCKGANWIPSDALPSRQTDARYEQLLQSAADANMNMLRVWGGGQYEKESFYRICDEKGIMIWHDFMFACSMYPSEKGFLDNVEKEIEYQVKRLKKHPSIVLWCGNNENIGALSWFEESRKNRDRYIIDYDRLNEGVIGKTVKKIDPLRKWWSSSPSAGEGDYSDCWHDDTKGDMHYWSVWHEGKPFEAYYEVVPRFCSEFGFQSFPSIETAKSFCPEEQLNLTSPVMEHHQRNDRGNSIIIKTITDYFRFPSGLEETIYLSRVQQAMAIGTAVEYWRSKRPVCMGALYWQLNDTWPVASWSSLDYDGGWKPLHYSAKRFFSPQLLTIHENDEGVAEIRLCNDGLEEMKGELTVRIYDFDGKSETVFKEMVSAAADSVSLLASAAAPKDKKARTSHFIHAVLNCSGASIEPIENFLLLDKPKRCGIKKTRINTELISENGKTVLKLSAEKPAFFTVLELPGFSGSFSDNNFLLLPGMDRKIELNGGNSLDANELQQKLQIHSLRNF